MKTIRILLIDDDPMEMEACSRALSGPRYAVQGARSRAEAVEFLDRNRGRAVVLSGIRADGESMVDFLKEMRRKYPCLTFAFLASSPSVDSAVEAMKAGAVEYLGKPASKEALRRAADEAAARMIGLLESEKLEKELRKEFSKSREDLHSARTLSSFKGFMISMASHDFRTILTVLDGYIRFLMEKCAGCPVTGEDGPAHRANRTVTRLLAMANTLLDFEAAETGKIRLEIRPFPLEETLRECHEFYKSYAESKRINLVLSPGAEGILVKADQGKVMEILDNLLYNALKFTPASGNIYLSGSKGSGSSIITVSDSGPGIPEEKLRLLFRPEHMASTLDVHARQGLGMMICKKLIEAQNGKIEVNSISGKGTTVCLYLPAV